VDLKKDDPPPPEPKPEQEVTEYDGSRLKAEIDVAQCIGRLRATENDLELDGAWSEIRLKYTGHAHPADLEKVQDAFIELKQGQ